jgi:glycosyltransferase involved in cell wall biosynthesis
VSYAIQSVLDQKYYDYELVVSVNHSRDETLHEIISLQDDHIKLLIPPSELSMSKHYEFILAHASGEWVTILGDDDALMPYFFLEADKLIENNPGPKLVSSQRAYYFWEGCQELYGDTVVDFKGFEGGNIKLSKVAMILSLLGLESYMSLPQLYTTGLFHKSLIQKIKDISDGNFYHSITPDAYSCVVGLSNYKSVYTF